MLLIYDISNRACAAVAFFVEYIFGHTAIDLFSQIGGIILCKALQDGFQQDAVCAGRNHLGCGNDADVVLFEQHLIAGAVVTVAGKTVELPDDDHIEQVLVAVLNHLLKRRAMVCPRGISFIRQEMIFTLQHSQNLDLIYLNFDIRRVILNVSR